jgi:hypothetical protein
MQDPKVQESIAFLNKLRGIVAERQSAVAMAEKNLNRATQELTIKLEAQKLLELAAKERGKSRGYVSELATFSLQAARGSDYSFSLDQEDNGIVPRITEAGYTDHVEGFGGAAQSSCGAGVRLATVILHPNLATCMVLDEPQRNLSTDSFFRWIQWMGVVSAKVGLQTFMVSHHLKGVQESELTNTVIYRFSRTNTFTTVERVKESV